MNIECNGFLSSGHKKITVEITENDEGYITAQLKNADGDLLSQDIVSPEDVLMIKQNSSVLYWIYHERNKESEDV